jgi:hypothetical protein
MLAALLLPSLLTAGSEPPPGAMKLNPPRVEYRPDEASATARPWIDANGWRILRSPDKTFVYHVKGEAAALASAEAFSYGAGALISADAPGASAFSRVLTFLKTVPPMDLPPVADFGVVDDASDATAELLNLLTRMNLLYKIEKNPDRGFSVNVRLGTKEYPLEEARNPSVAAQKIRSRIGDDNRSLRIYGSEVVIARLMAGTSQARVFLLNYAAAPVRGLRVRVRGVYSRGELRIPGPVNAQLADWTQDGSATEFTVPTLGVFAVIDLSRKEP